MYLVISGDGSKIFDNRRQADSERVELTSDDTVELEGPKEGQVLATGHHLLVPEREDIEGSLKYENVNYKTFKSCFSIIEIKT